MASRRIEERRAQHKRYKEDVEREGKPFFPHAMFHDTVMSLVVVSVIIGLAVVWYYDADGTEAGLLGPALHGGGRSRHDRLHPAPGLVLLLPLLPAPDLQVAGHRRSRHGRDPEHPARDPDRASVHRPPPRAAPLRRPVAIVAAIIVVLAMGTLTYKGATAEEALGSQLVSPCRSGPRRRASRTTRKRSRAEIFAQVGCGQCHQYLGTGASNLGAPDLSDVGASDRGPSTSRTTSPTRPSSGTT